MNNLKSFSSYSDTNEGRFNFGKGAATEDAENRAEMVKKRREILQKISTIKHQLTHTKTPKATPIMDLEDVTVGATDVNTEPVELKAHLESLRNELLVINKLLS